MSVLEELIQLGIHDAATEIRSGRLSSHELTQACLLRISERDPIIGAFEYLDPEFALRQAHAADELQKSGVTLGPLHGVPIAIKDIIDTRDMPTQNGSLIFEGRQPEKDARCVSVLRNAGAIILGKTVTTELALLTPALTKNPANIKHTPGGSSAGSAAAVADHMVGAALGTQTAGSILRPASYCGVYGFKPTRGLFPRGGVLMQSHTLDTVGVLARSLEDIALLAQVLAVYEPDDEVAISLSLKGIEDKTNEEPSLEPRFAFVKTPVWQEADASLHKAYGKLVGDLKDTCEEIEIENFADVIEWQRIVQIAENAAFYGPLLDARPQHISTGLTTRIEQGRRESVTGYIDAILSREKAYASVSRILDKYDAILTPAATGPAPQGFSSTGSPIFNGSWTYLGMPALSLPLLRAQDMPLGVQLVGKRKEDARLLQTASWLERHLNNTLVEKYED